MEKEVRPIDANALARKIREYMEDFPNAVTRLATCRVVLSMLGDEGQTPTILQPTCNQLATNVASGKTLTVEQMRKMDNTPIWVIPIKSEHDYCGWCVVSVSDRGDKYSCAEIPGVEYWSWNFEDYGKSWIAYAYPPDHIDWGAWEPCESCISCENCKNNGDYDPYEGSYGECGQCYGFSDFEPSNFCRECGRPLTEEAQGELEKRLRG